MKTIYKKTQYVIFLNAILLIVMVFLTYGYVYQTGNKPLPLLPYSILMLVFIVVILFFYKLTIIIDNEKIEAIFGIGLLKKSIKINDIKSIENYKIPWYAGIGIRLTPKGWLWNVSLGNAVLINNKTTSKTFLVGSNEVDKVINIINTQIKKH